MSTLSDTAGDGVPARVVVQTRAGRRGIALALLAVCLWSTSGVLVDRLVIGYHITPLVLSWWRATLASAVLAAVIVLRQPGAFRLSRREVPYYVAYGLIGIALFNVIWSASVQVNKAAVGVALIFSAPAFVALGDWLLFGKRLTAAQGGAVAVNLLGCVLVAGVYSVAALVAKPTGLALGLASGLTFALYTIFGKGATGMGYRRSSLTILFYVFLFSAIGLFVCGLPIEGRSLLSPALDVWGWCLLVALSLGPTLGGYSFFTVCLRYLPATVASLFTTLELPIAAILALLLLGRAMSALQWLGAALIVAGVLAVQVSSMRQPR